MSKSLNARLVFIRSACLLVAFSYAFFSCAAGVTAQMADGYGNAPVSQGQAAGTAQSSQALPYDWPQTVSVPGMENVAELTQNNNISYAIQIISQDGNNVNFQVKAFCVSNPQSEYAILHVLDDPLVGVVDPDKKTLQIDFSPLAASPGSMEIIDKADVDKVLMQEPDTLVLNTDMSVQSVDSSQVKFSLSDMSLLQPDGVLNEFSLPGPVPAVFDPATARFSTVAFDEMTNVLQQNFVYIQQNTVVNVVNVVNQVNVINVAGFGGFCGGVPFGGYGYGGFPGPGFGGYGGYGDYGGYGGYGGAPCGGFMPWSEPLPLAAPHPAPPLRVPDDVPLYDARPDFRPDRADTPGHGKLPLKERVPGSRAVTGNKGKPYNDKNAVTAKLPAADVKAAAQPKTADIKGVKAPVKAIPAQAKDVPSKAAPVKGTATNTAPKTPVKQAEAPHVNKAAPGGAPVKPGTAKPALAPKTSAAAVKTPDSKPAVKSASPAAKTAVAKTNAPDRKPAVKTASQPAPVSKTSVAKSSKPQQLAKAPVQSAPVKQYTAPKTSVAKSSKPQQLAKAPVQSAPKAAYKPAKVQQQAPAKAISQARPAASRGASAKGGGRR